MLYLTSQSPRRRQLLEQLGAIFTVIDIEVPEVVEPGESPLDYVSRVAHDKAFAGWQTLSSHDDAAVIAADTEVVLDDRVYGKPVDAADACAMLASLSGREHQVISVVWLKTAQGAAREVSLTTVRFESLSAARIEAYVATGEAFGKAGAYGIQGRAGAFIEHLSGSYTGVMGLPVFETDRLLRGAGVLS
jgi:septum formation protein